MRWRKPLDAFTAVAGIVFFTVVLAVVVHNVFGRLPRAGSVLVNEGPAAIAAIVLVSMWGWWRKVGWRLPNDFQLGVLWLLILLCGPAIAVWRQIDAPWHTLVGAAFAALLVGFAEEIWFRGIVLSALLDRGPYVAAIVSSLAFGGLHIINLGTFGARYVALQITQAAALGLIFAAVRIRLESLWPVILFHAVLDYSFIAGHTPVAMTTTRPPTPSTQLPLIAGSLLFALVTLRRSQTSTVASRMDIHVSDADDPELERVLGSNLNHFNVETTGIDDGKAITVSVKNDDGEIVAGMNGHSWGGSCFVDRLWVHDSLRGEGVGTRIMDAVEAEARARGCHQVVLFTHSFQAPAFYEGRGYERLYTIPDKPKGYEDIAYRKAL